MGCHLAVNVANKPLAPEPPQKVAKVRVPFRERYRVSRAIFRESWLMLRRERDLMVFPAAATGVMLLSSSP